MLAVLVLASLLPLSQAAATWSSGKAGVSLNGSVELEIYSVASATGGYLTHFWLTGGDRQRVDNAIVGGSVFCQ